MKSKRLHYHVLTFKGMTEDQIETWLIKWKKERKACHEYETTTDMAIHVFDELLEATRTAYMVLRKEGDERQNEYRERILKTKATLGNLRRRRQEHNRAKNNADLQDSIDEVRRLTVGTT